MLPTAAQPSPFVLQSSVDAEITATMVRMGPGGDLERLRLDVHPGFFGPQPYLAHKFKDTLCKPMDDTQDKGVHAQQVCALRKRTRAQLTEMPVYLCMRHENERPTHTFCM